MKAASLSNDLPAWGSCGINLYDPNNIPDHHFSLSDALKNQDLKAIEPNEKDEVSKYVEASK